jgi:hypothetical protein
MSIFPHPSASSSPSASTPSSETLDAVGPPRFPTKSPRSESADDEFLHGINVYVKGIQGELPT